MSHWTVRLTHQATQDVVNILDWTLEHFGPLQLSVYTDLINDASDTCLIEAGGIFDDKEVWLKVAWPTPIKSEMASFAAEAANRKV